jgi:predicted SAM-dependent methyltransferase
MSATPERALALRLLRRAHGKAKRGARRLAEAVAETLAEPAPPPKVSETSKCRASLAPYCVGDGLDIGYGGDPIVPTAICMDLPDRYAAYADHPQHLAGDAADLRWFRDGSLDYVYSSHVLEDFEDTGPVLREWLRVLRPGGHLVLYLPDEQTYRAHCARQGKPPNPHHVHADFGPSRMRELIADLDVEVVHERFPVGIYSFELVLRKGDAS